MTCENITSDIKAKMKKLFTVKNNKR